MRPIKYKKRPRGELNIVNGCAMLIGEPEICDFFGVKERVLYYWIRRFALPVCQVPVEEGKYRMMLPRRDAYRWLRMWRPREYLYKTGEIEPPPEYVDVVEKIIDREKIMDDHAEWQRIRKHKKEIGEL